MAGIAIDFLLDDLKLIVNKRIQYEFVDIDRVMSLYGHLENIRILLQHLMGHQCIKEHLLGFEREIECVVSMVLTDLDPFVIKVLALEEEEDDATEKCFHVFDSSWMLAFLVKKFESIEMKMKGLSEELSLAIKCPKVETSSSPAISSKPIDSGVGADEIFVGFEDEVVEIKDQLVSGKMHLGVISFSGMAGIGKTKLAKRIYNDDLIAYHFYLRAWVCVSREYRKRDLILSILSCIIEDKNEIMRMDDEDLPSRLYKRLKGNRYLIVMDDIWNIDALRDLRNLFPDDGNGSRIIFTTRLNDLALHIKPVCSSHSLRLLTENESWDLLERVVFVKNQCPLELINVGKRIAAACQGLPLAIIVVAGLLSREFREEFWEQVAKSIRSYASSSEKFMDILALSYDHLPNYLQWCFLYFGAFPEDSEILANRLMWLWIAEGFICSEEGKALEDVAEGYLMDLVHRNLVIVSDKTPDSRIRVCHVHDMLRELCLRKAEAKSSVQYIDWYKRVASQKNPTISKHACIHSHGFHYFSEQPCTPNAPLFFECVSEGISLTHQVRLFECVSEGISPTHQVRSFLYKFIRVLNLSYILLEYFPDEILQLYHLRFLEFWVKHLDQLPKLISNLWNLEILIIDKEDWGAIKVPPSIWKLTRLRHLRMSEEIEFEKPSSGIGALSVLSKLRTLSALKLSNSAKDAEDVLARTPNLRKLTFYRTPFKAGKFTLPSLANLKHLEALKWSENSWGPTRARIPQPSGFPENLKKVILSGGNLDWDEVSNLGKLPNLEILKLRRNCFNGPKWETHDGEFSRLKFLKLSFMDLHQWITSSDHFPCLEGVVIERCKSLEEIPPVIGDIPTLRLIEVRWSSSLAVKSARAIQEEQQNMGNDELKFIIPSLDEEKDPLLDYPFWSIN